MEHIQDIRPRFGRRAYIYSALFHGALYALFLNIPIALEVEEDKFFELQLGTISRERVARILEASRLDEAARRTEEQGLTPSQRIEVPDRRMIEIEEPTISMPNQQRIDSADIITAAERLSIEVEAPDVSVPATDGSIFPMDRKAAFEGSRIDIGDQPGAGIETGTIGADLIFEIEGEIKGRDILANPLPAYPEGLNTSATIKIRFEVLPDGAVSSSGMIPVRKENAVLEDLTMQTLKLWRFSPLPAGDQRRQAGIITFNYRVK